MFQCCSHESIEFHEKCVHMVQTIRIPKSYDHARLCPDKTKICILQVQFLSIQGSEHFHDVVQHPRKEM